MARGQSREARSEGGKWSVEEKRKEATLVVEFREREWPESGGEGSGAGGAEDERGGKKEEIAWVLASVRRPGTSR